MITLAFYKGRGSSWWIRLQDGLIRFATRSPYSHVELIVGRAEHDREETCLSSSGRDGGVREKRIVLERAKWDLVDLTDQPDEIEEALWMPVAEYLGSVEVSPFNKRIVEAAVHSPGLAPATVDGYGDPSKYEFFLPAELTGPPRSD